MNSTLGRSAWQTAEPQAIQTIANSLLIKPWKFHWAVHMAAYQNRGGFALVDGYYRLDFVVLHGRWFAALLQDCPFSAGQQSGNLFADATAQQRDYAQFARKTITFGLRRPPAGGFVRAC
jgi:hypothetical protein